ncbi:MAG: heme-copper oxidase subunit III [Magnetococcales bacterium]|nr:heme-copper oxidase subunit III [Magnetococcales bacterium]
MSEAAAGHHEHHWEWSWAPMAVVIGVFLILPLGFSTFFVYENVSLTIALCGIGTPILLAGIAKWVAEGLTVKPLVEGLAGVAIPLFIVSEVFIFLGLFASYWTIRLSAGEMWPPEGTPVFDKSIPLIMTVILVASSITYHVAEVKAEAKDLGSFRNWVMITLVLGFVFLGLTIYEYQHLLHMDFGPSTNSYSTAFYTITGFHASHVLVGLCIFIAVLIPAFKGLENHTFTSSAGVYWHFVDVVWFFVASQLYFW